MSVTPNPTSQVRNLLLIFILLNTIFLASVPLLPFIDLPNHLAEAAIYKFYEPGNLISKYYQPTPWYFPNSFHTVFCSLFPSVETGNKVFHIIYIILLQGAVFLAIRQLKGNPWYGLLAILFTYNYNVSFGFVGFAISLPFLVILFYFILLDIQRNNIYLKVSIAILLVLLFLMHAQNALLGLLMYGLMMLYHYRKSIRNLVIHCVLIPLPLLIMIFTWWFTRDQQNEGSTLEYLKDYYTSDFVARYFMRFRIVVFDNFQLQEGTAGLIIASFFFLCVIFPVVWFRPWRNRVLRAPLANEAVYAGIFLIVTLGCYLLVPDQLPGQTPIFQRFCTIVMLAFIILASVWLRHLNYGSLKYFVVAVCTVYTGLWFEYMYCFNRENKDFNRDFFAGMEENQRLVGLIYENTYRGRKTYIHYPNYFIVWCNGIAASKIIDYRFGVVRRVAPESQLPFYNELIGEHYTYHPEYRRVDYLLVRGQSPVKEDRNLDEFSIVREAGSWKLYKNNSPGPIP